MHLFHVILWQAAEWEPNRVHRGWQFVGTKFAAVDWLEEQPPPERPQGRLRGPAIAKQTVRKLWGKWGREETIRCEENIEANEVERNYTLWGNFEANEVERDYTLWGNFEANEVERKLYSVRKTLRQLR